MMSFYNEILICDCDEIFRPQHFIVALRKSSPHRVANLMLTITLTPILTLHDTVRKLRSGTNGISRCGELFRECPSSLHVRLEAYTTIFCLTSP